ncbi:MAG: hypothetical protein WA584_23075 [Pyrinomonadaceae bacterium]
MQLKIKNSEEFEKLLKALAWELVEANIFFKLYLDIKATTVEYTREFNESNTFWFLTLTSLLDTTLLRLCRVYDGNENANCLPNLLDIIKTNLDIFDEKNFRNRLKDNPFVDSLAQFSREPDLNQLDQDIEYVNKKTNLLVENLIIWRGNIIAHKNAKNIIKGKNLKINYPLNINDISELLEKGMAVALHQKSLSNE